MAAAAILKKSKNRHISAAVGPILTKFGTVKHFDPLDRSDREKFEIFKIQDGGGKIEESPYFCRDWTDFEDIWHD